MNNTDTMLTLLKQIELNTRRKPQITLEFKMTENKKTFHMDVPISLEDGNYTIGLIEMAAYNSVFNITTANNNLRYSKDDGTTWIDIDIPEGAYEIDQINDEIHRQLELNDDVFNDPEDDGYPIELSANLSTQKSIIELKTAPNINSPFQVNLTATNSIASLLGFDSRILVDEYNLSENKVNIITIDKIHLCCDFIEGSILNGLPSSILFSFVLDAGPGYKIIKEPNVILYKKINKSKLESLYFYLLDDDGNEVDLQGETLTFTTQVIKT